MSAQENSARMSKGQFQPGQSVPCSGVYRISHDMHREDHDGILLEGQIFPQCGVCRAKVRFALLQASNPIEQQPDFER